MDKCRAGLGAAFGAALIIAWVLRKISRATWRQTLWPRREPADWEKAPPSCLSAVAAIVLMVLFALSRAGRGTR